MKITDVQVLIASVPQRDLTPASPSTQVLAHQMVVRILTDEAITGLGECFAAWLPAGVRTVVEGALRPLLLGADPLNREQLWQAMYRATYSYGRRGLALWALSGIDIALWDILGKVCNQPLYQLLGGVYQPRVTPYASLPRYPGPEGVLEALERRLAEGYRAFKLHARDLPSIVAARRRIGEERELMVDVNGAWNRRQALRMSRELKELGVRWLEEPIWPPDDYAELAALTAESAAPIAAGEGECTHYGFRPLIAQKAVDVCQPSVARMGGLTEAWKVCAMADAWHLEVAPHAYYYGPGWVAALHLAAAAPNALYLEMPPPLKEDILLDRPPLEDGALEPPAGPGLGVTLNEDVFARYRWGE